MIRDAANSGEGGARGAKGGGGVRKRSRVECAGRVEGRGERSWDNGRESGC